MSKPDANNITNINNNAMNQSSVHVIDNLSNIYNLSELNKENKSEINSKNGKDKINCSKKKIILIIALSFLGLLIIAGLLLIIGYFAFDWFKKKKELILERKTQENFVSRYLETKNATNCYNYTGTNDTQTVQNNTIITDFIVGLNKKTKIYDLNELDYLYENFLLIINITQFNETDSLYLGGINIYDETKTIQDLIKLNNNLFPNNTYDINNETNKDNNNLINETQNNIPFCKFYFYENGTLENIYFPKNINEFYKSAIEDLIEKVTPKLSKSLYKNETNRRRLNNREEGVYLNFEQIIRNGLLNKTLIYEDKIEKKIDKNEDEYTFEKNELNSKITRTFNPLGDMILLEMKGEALFLSSQLEQNNNNYIVDKQLRLIEEENEKKSETNQTYYNLGLNEFKMNVSSNMVLIKTASEPTTLQKLNKLSQIINLELYKPLNNSNFYQEQGNETDEKTGNESLIEMNDTNYINNKSDINSTKQLRNLANKDINYCSSYSSRNKIISVSFLGLNVGLNQYLYINNRNGLRQNYINLIIGSKETTISIVNMYQYSYSGAKYTIKEDSAKKFGLNKRFNTFGYLISVDLSINCYIYHGISIDVINGEMYTKGFTTFDLTVGGSFGPNFVIISFGASITGHISKGNSYIQANTLLNINSQLSKFVFSNTVTSSSVDLKFYFSIWLLFWKKTYSTTINLFKRSSSNQYYYEFY